ncbi:MAG: selenide, water dikinase SelD, partial [Terriglobia bacterium]
EPKRVLSNAAARPGDRLVLTKRIGTGVIGTALKKGVASEASVQAAIKSMVMLNRDAGEVALEHGVRSATDITGFGLLGHAREMAAGSKVSLVLDSSQVDLLPGALEYAAQGYLPGGQKRNVEFISCCVEFAPSVSNPLRSLLFDPQTSGGLLLSVPAAGALSLLGNLTERGVTAKVIGEVVEKRSPLISVR